MVESFKLGDSVRLKSGGPIMMVCYIEPEGEVFCEWFDDHNLLQLYFKPGSLVRCNEDI
jgi:uncharacterized protein YodC (DUF2158 family)